MSHGTGAYLTPFPSSCQASGLFFHVRLLSPFHRVGDMGRVAMVWIKT
jgi:hypothetical protein